MQRIVVVGAGLGGLTTAAVLAKAGLDVTVLEAHIYPGGCAGTFYHQGYQFDAGATLAGGFYEGGPMDLLARSTGISHWGGRSEDLAMVVHMPDGISIWRWGDSRRHQERITQFGKKSIKFFQWQEHTADGLWDLALRLPDWPPQTAAQLTRLIINGGSWIADNIGQRLSGQLLVDGFRSMSEHLKEMPERLKLFVDAQLLISAQSTSINTNALYGASALDLPRRGVRHFDGGIGSIAERLAQAVSENGGSINYRQEVNHIVVEDGQPLAVETKKDNFPADYVIFNLPPWNIAELLKDNAPARIRNLPTFPKRGWGAFMLYLGVDNNIIPNGFPLHHQIIDDVPMGEGKTVFLSISPEWDKTRAKPGKRALTISTHTDLSPWWEMYDSNRDVYQTRKQTYTEHIFKTTNRILPGLKDAADLVLPGTPITFKRFTRRAWGWVGGFPQIDLFQTFGPRLSDRMWMVGDSIFPGQSMASVALGGLRVANNLLMAIDG